MRAGVLSLGNFNSTFLLLSAPISSAALAAILIVELHITPLDTAEAGPEIMSGSGTEYSGKNLAFYEFSNIHEKIIFCFSYALTFIW